MRQLRAFWIRLKRLISTKPAEADFGAELESHLHMNIDDNLRAGMTPERSAAASGNPTWRHRADEAGLP